MREVTEAVILVKGMYVGGKRGRGKPKKKLPDTTESDTKRTDVEDAGDRLSSS